MKISFVVAMDESQLIGKNGKIPWHLPADLEHFKELTLDKYVVMGRKTFESIGKALPNRINIVITSKKDYTAPDCIVVHSKGEALNAVPEAEEMMVIGGAEIYKMFSDLVEYVYLTVVEGIFEGDTYFPFSLSIDKWRSVNYALHDFPDGTNKFVYAFHELEKRNPQN